MTKKILTLWDDKDIRKEDERVLRKPATELSVPFDTEATADIRTLMDAFLERNDALGLAAPQIGISRKIIIFRNKGFEEKTWTKAAGDYDVLINPRIVSTRGELVRGTEGCLSCPEIQVEIDRFPEIKVQACDPKGKTINKRYVDFLARIVQHEIDHLEGILILDRAENLYFPNKRRDFFEEIFQLKKDKSE
ncbi:MAG: peptide deformylase [Syntrophaceae bacterium]|nr:peptide deformylase [Syntrophaceae bacterium]